MPKASRYWNKYDLNVILLLLALGALQFALIRRAADYLNDTNYFELFNSILHNTGYGFNHRPMTQLPPGLPYLLALLSLVIGSSYTVMLRVMTVVTTLALVVSYALLRSRQDRGVAAMSCLLLGTAPALFAFSTSMVFADMPYFFASILLLYVAIILDEASDWRLRQTLLWLLWGVLLIVTVLLKSAGISLLGAVSCWIAVSYFKDRQTGRRRLRLFLPMVLAAVAAEGGWMLWAAKHQLRDWSLPGYQEHYVAQLRLKSANTPELGLATWKDVMIRPIKTGDDAAAAMVGLFTHKQMAAAWYSPGTVIPMILILLGLGYSFRNTGGSLLEWYFVSYQSMFLFWPWDFELRFLFPVAPLAFLYAWRGGRVLWQVARDQPRLLGASGLALAVIGCLSSLAWGQRVPNPKMWWCITLWLLFAGISIGLLWSRREGMQKLALLLGHSLPVRGRPVTLWQHLLTAAVVCACLVGVASQLQIGLANVTSDLSKDDFNYPDIEAAQWIKAHSAPSSVVMARKDDIVYHYSQRRVIWFPPSRDAAMLMNGISRYHVQYVVVHYGNDTYWKPPAQECFDALSRAYPGSFKLAHAGPHNSVFEVSPDVRSASSFPPQRVMGLEQFDDRSHRELKHE
jgi:hypothetical protein